MTQPDRLPSDLPWRRRVLEVIDRIAAMLVIITMAGMVCVVSTQVFLRYGLNSSLAWSEEVARLLFVWSVFLAIPLGIKRGAHVGVDMLVAHVPESLRNTLFRLMSAFGILLMAVVAWHGSVLARNQWDEPMTTLDVSVGLFMVPLLTGAVHSILHLIFAIFDGPPAKDISSE